MGIARLFVDLGNWLSARREQRRARAALAEQFATLGPDNTERLLHDCGLSTAELPALMRHHPDVRHALERLLAAVGVERRALGAETLRDLGVACISCRGWRRCKRELARGTASATYPDFCPNAPRIDVIRAVRPGAGRFSPVRSAGS